MKHRSPHTESQSTIGFLDLKDYRQPMVTSLGVLLGFLVGFLGQWVTEPDFELKGLSEHVALWGCVAGLTMLLLCLFRMLTPLDSSECALNYYKKTLTLYILGISCAFVSLLLSAFL